MTVYPALLSDSISELQTQLDRLQSIEQISCVQIDVIDGYFADNITITPSDLPDLDFGRLQFDLHLMVLDPQDFLHEVIARADELPVRAVLAQVERMHHQAAFLESVRKQTWTAGLSLDRFTPVEAIDEDSWQHLDMLQVMGVEAGFQGQDFSPGVLETVSELQALMRKKKVELELLIDGGVSMSTIHQIQAAGVESVAVGSALWQSASLSDTIDALMQVKS